jgi:hypothetical protein
LNNIFEVKGFFTTVCLEFGPVPSYKAMMPNLGLCHRLVYFPPYFCNQTINIKFILPYSLPPTCLRIRYQPFIYLEEKQKGAIAFPDHPWQERTIAT